MSVTAVATESPPKGQFVFKPSNGADAAPQPVEQRKQPAKTEEKPKKSNSKLRAVDPKAASPSKPKILIFGKPGVGKTWTSLDFPSVYYIDTEGGADLNHYTDKLKKAGGVYFGPDVNRWICAIHVKPVR